MTNLQFTEQRATLKKNAAILMFLGRDLEHFSGLPKLGTISKSNIVKPDTTKVTQELTQMLKPIIESLKTKDLVSPEVNRLFFKDILSALEGHEKVASFKRLNSQLPTKTDNMKRKI